MRKLILSVAFGALALGLLAVAPSAANAGDRYYYHHRGVVVVPRVRAYYPAPVVVAPTVVAPTVVAPAYYPTVVVPARPRVVIRTPVVGVVIR